METDDVRQEAGRLHVAGKGDPFAAAIRATRMPMTITDPRQHDNPIVFVNDAFLALTGYDRAELIGRNCRFLQGPDTDRIALDKVRAAIKAVRDVNVDILNYRKDGSSFWNALYVSPVLDEAGELQFFFASQLDVSDRKGGEFEVEAARDRFERISQQRTREFHEALGKLQDANAKLEQALETQTALLHEVDHRVKNNLQMVSALVVLQSRAIPDEAIRRSLMDMLLRIEALGTVHRRLYQSDDVTRFDVGEFIRDLVMDLVGVGARDNVKAIFDLENVIVPAEHAGPIALIVNEVVTNALKHAFPDLRKGTLTIKVLQADDRLRIEIFDDGIGENVTGISDKSFGTSLIRTLSRQLKADVAWSNNHPGTRVTIEIPIRRGPSLAGTPATFRTDRRE